MLVVIWERPDGRVSFQYATVSPDNISQWERMLKIESDRLTAKYGAPPIPHIETVDTPRDLISDHDCSPACEYFNALTYDNGVKVDMEKAKNIHMDNIRLIRNKELDKLDIDYVRALESGDIEGQEKVKSQKQYLRDIPQTFSLDTPNNKPDELKSLYPEVLWPNH